MPRYRFFHRNRSGTIFSSVNNPSKKKIKRYKCSTIAKYILQGSIPFTIAIFTIVAYINDVKIAELARDKDWKIALNGLEIANETRLQDLKIANETRYHDRQLAEEERHEDRQQQQDLHYQDVYSKYIEDISNVVYKLNQSIFLSEEAKMLYIRRRTLMTIREINPERRGYVFIFLYENKLLPDRTRLNSTISLEGANFQNIIIKSPPTNRYTFNALLLDSVNLINATFIDCIFTNGVHFIGSAMTNISFINTKFTCEDGIDSVNLFKQVSLDHSNFQEIYLCTTRLVDTDLSSSIFNNVQFQQVSLIKTNLSHSSINITQKGIIQLNNVILPNGTLISKDIINISICAQWSDNGTIIAGGIRGDSLTELNSPCGIYIDIYNDNTLYVADSVNKRVIKFKQGELNGRIIIENIYHLQSVLLDEEQNLYVTAETEIFKFIPDYDTRIRIAGENSEDSNLSKLQDPFEILLDDKKNLFISDTLNHRILMWTPNANEGILIAGISFQEGLDSLHLSKPRGIFLDIYFNALYVADYANHRVQRFSPIGNFTGETVAGVTHQAGANLYQLNSPSSVFVLNNRDIFITDSYNKRIVRWILGNYTAGGTCIIGCTGILQNVFQYPIDMKFDSYGNMIVCDSFAHSIQKFELINNQC